MARKPRSMRQRTALAMAQRIGGPPAMAPKKRTGPRAWLRYAFDNSLARGTPALIGWLIIATAFLVLCFAVVQFVANLGQEDRSFAEVAFDALLTVIDPSTADGNSGSWVFLLTLLVLVLGGLFIVSGLIGVIAAGIEVKLVDLRRGRSIVLEAEHTVILGWSESIFTILKEVTVANESPGRKVIAVLADRDKVEMEDELRSKVRGLRGTRVVCRSGSPSDPDDLALVRPETARSVIVLSPDVHDEDRVEGFDPDAAVIKNLLALRSIDSRGSSRRVVAEVRHPASVDAARLIGRDGTGTTSVVDIREMVAKLMVQTSRESGAAAVYRELFDYEGDAIYFMMHHGLGDVTYADAVVAFEHLTVLGVISPYGATSLNPTPETRVRDLGLVVLGEDESTLKAAARSEAPPRDDAYSFVVPEADRPTRTVLIGWNDRAPLIVRELGTYAAPGSTLTVLTAYGDPDVPQVEGLTVTVVKGQTTQRSVLEEHLRSGLDHVMVLCYSDHLPAEAADSLTLITLVHVRDILSQANSSTPVVSELIDDRNRVLAQIANIDDVVVSGEIVSLVVTQLSEDPRIEPVLDELLGAEGTDIYIRPAEWYVVPYREVTWSTFVASAGRRGETAIGYASPSFAKPGSTTGVALNPAKSETVVVGSGDRVVVLAKH